MAQLKDSIITGSLRVTDTTFTNDISISKTYTARHALIAPTSDGAPTFRALVKADISDFPSSMTPTSHEHAAGDITSGKLGVARGGTGADSFTANSAIVSGNTTTGALTTRGILNNTAVGTLGWDASGNTNANNLRFMTVNTLAYWDGSFRSSDHKSNLTYCVKGTIGNAAIKDVDDRTSVSALTNLATWANNANLPTVNLIAYWDGRYQTKNNLSHLTYLNNRINFPTITGGTGVTASDLGASANPRYRPASWKFNAGIAPVDGDVVTVKKPSALHDYGTWLSLDNGTTWHPIVHSNTGRVPDWFNNNFSITLRYDATGTCSVFGSIDTTNKVMLATNSRSTATGVWRLWTMYDTGNDLGIRVYNQTSGFNDDYPFLVSRTNLSTQIGTNNSNSSNTNTVYGVIWDSPNRGTHNKTPTVNISTGMVKFHSLTLRDKLIGTSTKLYGTTLPTSPVEGQVFFQTSDPWYELPAGGSAGQVLMKNSNSNYDVKWGDTSSGGGIDTIYPIGAIFISTVDTNPGTYMSGTTWEAFGSGKILVGVNSSDTDFNTVEKTGGGKTVTIAETNLPSHTHSIPSLSGSTDNQGSHKHTFWYGRSWGVGAHDLPSASSTDVALKYEWLPTNNMENAGGHTHTVTTTASTSGGTGSGTALNVMNPYITVYMWKRTA